MVAATQPQQHPSTAAASTTTATATSVEDEALKRNTDCVYFLASPLTCKKGSECEYRHSEYARVNPRDCYFWLNGNCLNPKCGFRHPPLDGLFGTQATASAGSSLPPSHTAAAPATHAPHNSGKQAVPCIFFQQGICVKGDRCAFSHGPNISINKVSQPMAPTPGTEALPPKKAFGGLQKCTQEHKIPQAKISKAAEAHPVAKPVSKPEIARARNRAGVVRNAVLPKSMDGEIPRYKAANLPPMVNGNSSRSNHLHQSQVADDHVIQNGKDADEYLRDSSPGFDVLVDDELRDSDYYHGEEQFGRTRGNEGRNLNSVDEYDTDHPADYGSLPDDREMYHDPRGYDSYERIQGQHAWEQHGASSERMLVAPVHPERRGYSKADIPEHTEESDLRYRLSKQRRVNGLRSVVSNDFVLENHVEERGYRGSRRDSHHLPSHESSISSRLRGRIKLPGRSPNNDDDVRTEREIDRGRNRGRLSPVKSLVSSQQGRLRDRMKASVEEDYNEGRNFRGPQVRRELMDDRSTDFAGPKSLAELKGGKNAEGKLQQSLGKRKYSEDHPSSDADLSFEGPMPLSEILKRKREAGAAASGSGISSVIKDNNNQKENRQSLIRNSNKKTVSETQSDISSVSKDDNCSQMLKNKEESKLATDGAIGTEEENIEIAHGQSSQLPNPSENETEDGMIADDGMEDHEYEGDDQRDGNYEYEQVDGEYNYEEGENIDGEEEYEDEDGDDFAKKIGVVFS